MYHDNYSLLVQKQKKVLSISPTQAVCGILEKDPGNLYPLLKARNKLDERYPTFSFRHPC